MLTALSLSSCNDDNNASKKSDFNNFRHSTSVFGQLRPKADPELVRKIQEEEAAAEQARLAEMERQQNAYYGYNDGYADPSQRNLPGVDQTPFSNGDSSSNTGGEATSPYPSDGGGSWATAPAPPPPPSSYGINYGTPSPGFVPPPPAISLSTSAQTYGGMAPPPPEYAAYANPYAYMQQQAAASGGSIASANISRSPSSPFGSGSRTRNSSEDDDDDTNTSSRRKKEKEKEKNIQVITPTGMESRSSFKQRDDLRILWKGALATTLAGFNHEQKFAAELARVDIGLPADSSRGALSVGQRQVESLFKNGEIDKKISASVSKTQSDLAQNYYRYLYAYNKFFLQQQQIAARKQELDLAETSSEKQRATTDLAQVQTEIDASKEDLRSSQVDLVSIAGPQAARTVIQRVSGTSPSLESLAQAAGVDSTGSSGQNNGANGFGGFFNSMTSAFGLSKNNNKNSNNTKNQQEQNEENDPVSLASDPNANNSSNNTNQKTKGKKKGKNKGQDPANKQNDPVEVAAKPDTPAPTVSLSMGESKILSNVLFELKDVECKPRKSILKVALRNNSQADFNFDADSVSIAEGNSKLSTASFRAEFDSTEVQPNQEIAGTITIFNRPWNDKLTVSLSNGGKYVVLHR